MGAARGEQKEFSAEEGDTEEESSGLTFPSIGLAATSKQTSDNQETD